MLFTACNGGPPPAELPMASASSLRWCARRCRRLPGVIVPEAARRPVPLRW